MLLYLQLQQYLPFTVLKHVLIFLVSVSVSVATVLTVYGIETGRNESQRMGALQLQQYLPFTVLKRKRRQIGLWRSI